MIKLRPKAWMVQVGALKRQERSSSSGDRPMFKASWAVWPETGHFTKKWPAVMLKQATTEPGSSVGQR